jgi:apolipoprotein N-acyltransferase
VTRFPKSIALVVGLISATGFAPISLWPVTIVAFAIWMWLVADAPNLRASLALGWWFGVGHFTVGMNWIAGSFRYQETMPVWLGWVAVVALALYLAVYPAVAAGLAWRWGRPRRVVYVLIFAAAWIVTEYLRATLFTGFAWNPLGVVMVPTPGDGVAKVIGTYGLSGLVIIVAGALRHPSRLYAFPLALGAVMVAGWLTTLAAGDPGRSDRVVRIVQPNIGQQTKHDDSFDELNWAKLAGLTGIPESQPRLILWPEAAVPYFLEEERWAVDRIARLMGPKDMLLTGGDAFIWDRAGKTIIAARNSLFAVTPQSKLISRYDKAHLVPYGEYLPMRPLLSAIGLSRLVPGDLDFWPGPGPQSINPPGFGKVGVQICYEIIFSGEVIDATNRPDFLFNPSNDAWFGAWGSPEFLTQARLRAIEEGMPVVRATPTGISAVIDSNGTVLVALPTGKAGFIQTRLPKAAAPTPFARFGNVLPFCFALLLVGLAVALRRSHR